MTTSYKFRIFIDNILSISLLSMVFYDALAFEIGTLQDCCGSILPADGSSSLDDILKMERNPNNRNFGH